MKLILLHIVLILVPVLKLIPAIQGAPGYFPEIIPDLHQAEENPEEVYKTLEIRYKTFGSSNVKELDIDGKKFKCFQDKKSAIKYYYLVKKDSPDFVVYYVFSGIPKPSEIYTFKITE